MNFKVTIDGQTFECDSANAQVVVDRVLKTAKDAADQAVALVQGKLDGEAKSLGDLKSEHAKLQAKYDGLEQKRKDEEEATTNCDECGATGKVDGDAPCPNCEGKGKFAKKADGAEKRKASFDRMLARKIGTGVKERASLIVKASAVLGANEKLDAKSDLEIQQMVVKKVRPKVDAEKLKNPIYVQAAFDDVIEQSEKVAPIAKVRATVVPSGNQDGTGGQGAENEPHVVTDADEASAIYAQRQREAFRKK